MTRLFHVVTGYELVVTKDFSSYKKRCFHVMKYKLYLITVNYLCYEMLHYNVIVTCYNTVFSHYNKVI